MIAVASHDDERSRLDGRFGVAPFPGAAADMAGFSAAAFRSDWSQQPYANVVELPQFVDAGADCRSTSRPRHFHLLSDGDLEELRPLLAALVSRREEVARRSRRQYS
ncbi:MAG TPA: hypothetical protein VJ718_03320, partial [Candidatus Binataceae bacterium]|nr:hypothetical protein [Candidatus Binataceae bacterium]